MEIKTLNTPEPSKIQNPNAFLKQLQQKFEPSGAQGAGDFLNSLKEKFDKGGEAQQTPEPRFYADKLRAAAAQQPATPPEQQGLFSSFLDDMGNIGNAWRAGNMYSKGGWNDIAKNIINGGTPEEREKLYQAYSAWKDNNPTPENKTWVGSVVNGVANLIPLTLDMQPEALGTAAITGAGGLAIGAATGPGAVATGLSGAGLGYKASMIEQSYKVGVADAYTSLREDGIDDETARDIALVAGIPYGALEYFGKAIAPIQRRLWGNKKLIDVIDKISDKKIKNKILNFVAKKGADIAITGTAETAVEGGQAGIVEAAKQSAKKEFDAGKIASAAWEEAKGAAPAMVGMAALGIPLEGAINKVRSPKGSTKALKKVQGMVEEGKKILEKKEAAQSNPDANNAPENGALPAEEAATKKYFPTKIYADKNGNIHIENGEDSNLDVDANSDPYGRVTLDTKTFIDETKRGAKAERAAQAGQTAPSLINILQNQQAENAAQAQKEGLKPVSPEAFINKVQENAEPEVAGRAPSIVDLVQMQEDLKAAQEAKKRQAEEEAKLEELAEQEAGETEAPTPVPAPKKKRYKRLTESERALAEEKKMARKEIDSIPDEEVGIKMEAIGSYDLDVLDDKDLEYAAGNGAEWADRELHRRMIESEETSHDTILDVMSKNGYVLPTPEAIKRHGGGSGLYGEIKDLYENMRAAGGKNYHYLQKFFRDQYVDLDDMAKALNEDEGFNFKDAADMLRELADNFAGNKTTRSMYSLNPDASVNTDDAHAQKINKALGKTLGQFYKNAKHKAKVYTTTSKKLAEITGKQNAQAAADKKNGRIIIATDKMESPKHAAGILLHEYVGHYGLRRLLGKDLKPFLAYIKNKYKGSAEWQKLEEDGYKSDDDIAEEMIAHLAEYRELSDSTMWRRLVGRVQRALKNDGVSGAYVNLLDEDMLRAAVIASRQWANGDLIVNSNGKWRAHTTKEVPDNKEDAGAKKDGSEYSYSLQDKTQEQLEKEHFGPNAKNGNFDLNNIDLNDYEGMDTSDWDNETWKYSWELNADIQYALNEPEDFPPHDWISAIGGEALPYGECKEISTRTLEDIIASKELARLAQADPEINVSGILAGIIAQPTAAKEVRKKAISKIKALNLFENAARELLKSHWADQAIVDDFVRDNAKNISEHNILWYDYVDYFTGDIIPSDIADKIIKWAKDSGGTGAYTIEMALKKNLFSDSDRLKCVKITPLVVAMLDNNDAATIAAINDELMRRDDRYVRDASVHIYDDITNGNFDGNIALLKPILKRMASLDERFINVTDKVITELAGKKVEGNTGYKAWSGDFSKRRPPQDLRDVAYYNALDRNAKADAKAIIAERMKESGYRESPELMHTSRAQDIRSFIFDDNLAKKNGEGVKAYGHGAYMTESTGTTKYYRKKFSNANADNLKIEFNGKWRELTNQELMAVYIRLLCDSEKEAEKLIQSAKWDNSNYVKTGTSVALAKTKGKKLRLDAGGVPRTYNIAWNLSPEETLNLDEPFSKQNPAVQKKILKLDRELTKALRKTKFHRALFNNLSHPKTPSDYSSMKELVEALGYDLDSPAEASRILVNFGIRGSKFANGQTRHKTGKKKYNYVSFEGGSALKLRENITRDEQGRIIPPSERFDPNNSDWNFSLINKNTDGINLDVADTNRGGKTLSALLEDAKDMHSKGVDMSKIFKQTGWELVDVGKDNPEWIYDFDEGEIEFPIGYELNTPVPLKYYIGNKKLFDVCPFLNDVNVEFHVFMDDSVHGEYDHKKKTISINSQFDRRNIVKTLIHETQHAIDQTNYLGGAPAQIGASLQIAKTARKYSDATHYSDATRKLAKELFDFVKNVYKLTEEDLRIEDPQKIGDLSVEKYEALTGEVTARNAAKRHYIDRINTSISTSEDNVKTKIHITEPIRNKIVDSWDKLLKAIKYEQKKRLEELKKRIKELGSFSYEKSHSKRNSTFKEIRKTDRGVKKDNTYSPGHTQNQDSYSYSLAPEESAEEKRKEREYKQKKAREQITSKAGRAIQAAVDTFAPLATLERIIYGKVRDAAKSAWKMALMTNNLDQVMFHILRVGGIKYNKGDGSFVAREGTKGLEEILKPVKGAGYKNFERYALAKSAFERWANLRHKKPFAKLSFFDVFGFSIEDAKAWIADGNAATKKAFDELQVFFQSQRDFMLETELITPEQHAALSKFKNYVPFFREGKDLEAEAEAAYERFSELFPGGKGFSGRKSGVEKFLGSTRKTKNLVENIVNQARRTIDNGYKNIAAYRALNLMREIDMAKYVRSDSAEAKVKIAELRRALEAEGIDVGDISDDDLLRKVPVEAYLDLVNDNNDNIVSVRVGGTLRFYKVEDPELLVAVKNFGAEKVNVLWKLLTKPKNWMTWAVTKTPAFAIRNFLRDTGSNAILFGGKTLAPYLARTVKNGVKTAFNTSDMEKIWGAGAGGGSWYSVKPEDISADFKDDVKTKAKRVGKYIFRPLSWLLDEYERRILLPSEQANRMSVMQKALDNGASVMEAAFQAMDVLNFGMRGSGVWTGKNEWAKGTMAALHAIVRITPFLNARIQGLYKLWRESGSQDARYAASEEFGVKNRSKAFVQAMSKAVLLRGMMLASAGVLYSLYANSSKDDDGEDWYEKLPAYDKLNYWHLYLGNNEILRIPKPFEIGYVFATIPEALTDALIQRRPQTAKVLWRGLTSQLEFDPLSNPVIDTMREQYWNKDSFSKRPIVQQSDKDLKPRYQYDPDTSASAKAIARAFEGLGLDDSWLASPARIQNVIGNFLGGMTKYVTAMSDGIVESLTDIEGGTSRYARESVMREVYGWALRNTKTMTTRNAEDYYDLRNRVREIYSAARILRQEKRLEECQNLIDKNKAALGNYNLIEAINTRLNEISRKRRMVGENKTLTTAEIIRKDDELVAERNRLLADVDILIDRVDSGNYKIKDLNEVLARIKNADKEKKDSKTAQQRLRELANMR